MADYIGQLVAKLSVDDGNLRPALDEARRAIDKVGVEVKQLDGDLKRGAIGSGEYHRRVTELTRAKKELGEAMHHAYSRGGSAVDQLGRSLEVSASKASAMGRGLVDLSRGVEDFATGGPLGALNNVPGVFANIGQSIGMTGTAVAKLTTGITLAATAAYVIYLNWGKLTEAMSGKEILTSTEMMEALAKATEHTVEQTRALAAAKREQAEVEDLLAKGTKEQAATGKAVEDVIAEGGDMFQTGGQKIVEALIRQFKEGGGGLVSPDTAQVKRLGEARGELATAKRAAPAISVMGGEAAAEHAAHIERLEKEIVDLNARMEPGVRKLATDTVLGAKKDPEGLARMVEKDPGLFPEGLAKDLRGAGPVARKEQDAEDERQAVIDVEFDEAMRLMREGIARRKQKRQEREREEAALETEEERDFNKANEDARRRREEETAKLASRKAKPLEGPLTDEILKRVQAGEGREEIMEAMTPDVARRVDAGPYSRDAAEIILRQVLEKIYGDIEAAAGPGVTTRQAAGKVRGEIKEAAEEKAERERAAEENKAGAAANKAKRQQEAARRAYVVRELSRGYGLNRQQAEAVAPRAEHYLDAGFSEQVAGRAAMNDTQDMIRRMGQNLGRGGMPRPQGFRRQPRAGPVFGFRSIAPTAEGGGGGGQELLSPLQATTRLQAQQVQVTGQLAGAVRQVKQQQQQLAIGLTQLEAVVRQLAGQGGKLQQQRPALGNVPFPVGR